MVRYLIIIRHNLDLSAEQVAALIDSEARHLPGALRLTWADYEETGPVHGWRPAGFCIFRDTRIIRDALYEGRSVVAAGPVGKGYIPYAKELVDKCEATLKLVGERSDELPTFFRPASEWEDRLKERIMRGER